MAEIVLTALLFLLVGFLTYLLVMPLELCLDSYRGTFFLRLGVLARLGVEKDPVDFMRLHLKVLFLHFYWRPAEAASWARPRKKPTPGSRGRKPRGLSLERWVKLLKTFRVKSFRLELDTGDPVANARLFPLFYLLGQRAADVGINFLGRNHVSLQIVNRPIYILNALFNPKK